MILTVLKRKYSHSAFLRQEVYRLQIERELSIKREKAYQERIAELEQQLSELLWHLNPAEEVQP